MIKVIVQPNLQPYFSADKRGFYKIMNIQGKVYQYTEGHKKVIRFCRGDKAYFAKIYLKIRLRKVIKSLLLFCLAKSKVNRELWAIQCLGRIGINSSKVVAYGAQRVAGIPIVEFIITEELPDMVSLDKYCQNWQTNPPSFILKRDLIFKIAELLRNLHANNMTHGDLRLPHLFIRSTGALELKDIQLSCIDLERARRSAFKTQFTRDIASLYNSVIKHVTITKLDIFRFMRFYSQSSLAKIFTSQKRFWEITDKKSSKYLIAYMKKKQRKLGTYMK